MATMRFTIDTRGRVQRSYVVIAIVLLLGIVGGGLTYVFYLDDPRPTAQGTFEFKQTSTGIEVVATTLNESVTVQLNGRDIQKLTEKDVGKPFLLPTAPGDRVTIVSRTGDKSVLVEEIIDNRNEVGDFVAYYTFEEGKEKTVVDHSRNGNDGILMDDGNGEGPKWIKKDGRTALRFDGNSDYVRVPDITTEGVENVSEFTVATTVRVTGGTGAVQQFVEHRYGDNEWYLETESARTPYGVSYAVRYKDKVVSSDRTLKVGKTYVLVGTYDSESDEYTLYIDGKKTAIKTFDREVKMGEMRIGRDFERNDQYLKGELSQFRLYYTSFSQDEVATLTKVMRD